MKHRVSLKRPLAEGQRLELMRTMGGRIALLRRESDMSQWDLALAVGVSQTSISLWERGLMVPNDASIKRLAKALRTSVASIKTDPAIYEPKAA